MESFPHIPYLIILIGLLLFFAEMAIDLGQHGKDFLVKEFQEAPWAHGLPLGGILVIFVGTVLGWRRAGQH
jgi:hypothetical protein